MEKLYTVSKNKTGSWPWLRSWTPYCQVLFRSVQFSLTLCNPMNWSMPGLPVHHQLPEFTQTHVHRVGDAIQPPHPLLAPSPLPSIFPSIRVFSNGLFPTTGQSIGVGCHCLLQRQPFLLFCISFSWVWSWSLPPVQCQEPPSIVLRLIQALYLSDLIPWIYCHFHSIVIKDLI